MVPVNSPAKPSLLFLNPPDLEGGIWMKEVGRCGRKSLGGEIWPQTGLAMLAAMAETEGFPCRIIDGMVDRLSPEALEAELAKEPPQLILINSATPTLENDNAVLKRLMKQTGALGAIVGPHLSALPRRTLEETAAHFGLINEAEETLVELVRTLENPATLAEKLPTISGLIWREPGPARPDVTPVSEQCGYARPDRAWPIHENPLRPPVPDLDQLPLPARHLLPNHAYRLPFFEDHPFATIIPARGCPWPCTFCRAGRVWGRKVRSRSIASILEEIGQLAKDYGIGHLVFMTDSLTLDRDWAMELFEALARLDPTPAWICNSRVDVIDEAMLRAMKTGGCRMVSYGLESGSPEILQRCRKGITLEQSRKAIALTRKAGLLSMGYFILGLPGETETTLRQTLRFAREVNPDYVNFHIATPFPGTALYEEALQEGWLAAENWKDFEEAGGAALSTEHLSARELVIWQQKAMRDFYFRPGKMLGELARLRSPREFRAKLRAARHLFFPVS